MSLSKAYPDAHEFDVRIMGGSQTPAGSLGPSCHPPSWLVYDYDEVDVRSFYFRSTSTCTFRIRT